MGGEPLSSSDLAAEYDAVLVVLLRSHYCPLCRELVQSLRDEYQSFVSQSTAVVPVLPDQVERGAVWQRRYELPFPVLADPGDGPGDDPSFDTFAPFHALFRALPGAVFFRSSGDGLEFVTTVGGERRSEFPPVAEVLESVENHTDGASPTGTGPRADS